MNFKKDKKLGKRIVWNKGLKGLPGMKGKDNPMYGKPSFMLGKSHSEETRKKISDSKKGKRQSTETKEKLSKSRKGLLSGKNNPMYGRPAPRGAGRTKWYLVNKIWVQGTYEKRLLEACIKWNVPIVKSKKLIPYFDGTSDRTYRPDFEIEGIDGFIEVKGWLSYKTITKMNACYRRSKIYMVWEDQLRNFEDFGKIEILKNRLIKTDYPLKKFIDLKMIKEIEQPLQINPVSY